MSPQSSERAFVIRFEPIHGARGRLRGRVEQVASGEAMRFRSSKELVAFMRRTLEERTVMKRAKEVIGAVAALLLAVGACIANAEERVAICHLPPGNPTNAHTIIVGRAAIDAHLGHGDQVGECANGCLLDPTLCDDGNACTSDPCDANGECGIVAVDCDDSDPCTDDGCDPASGCTYSPARIAWTTTSLTDVPTCGAASGGLP